MGDGGAHQTRPVKLTYRVLILTMVGLRFGLSVFFFLLSNLPITHAFNIFFMNSIRVFFYLL